jgi:hypothetical protein
MRYILLALISLNTFAEIKYTRLQGDSNQGSFIVDTHEQANKRINKMIKAAKWMKCDWKADEHESNITKTNTFSELVTPDNPLTIDIDESVYADVEVITYCHPKTFSIVSEDVTDEMQAERDAKQVDKDERQAIKAMISNVNDSDKPSWEKKLLKKLIKDMRE